MQVFKFPTPDRIEMSKKPKTASPAFIEASRLYSAMLQHKTEINQLAAKVRKYRKMLELHPNEPFVKEWQKQLTRAERMLVEQSVKLLNAEEAYDKVTR
jgi:hypothetical protein